jgi:hypothetical protein
MALKLVKGIGKSQDKPKQQKSREHYLVACLREERDDPKFSDWEKEFIGSIANQIDQGRALSEKQKDILERLWKK